MHALFEELKERKFCDVSFIYINPILVQDIYLNLGAASILLWTAYLINLRFLSGE